MRLKSMLGFFRGWSDLFLTPAEVLLPKLGLYRVTRWILDWHYADPNFRPWAKELVLAEICERTGEISQAEAHYQRVIRPGNAFGYLFLGAFYERHNRIDAAISTFENALSLSVDDPSLAEQLRQRLDSLRCKAPRNE